MKKNINISILDKEDFFDKYNEERVSKGLIEYIIEESRFVKKRDDLSIILSIDDSNNSEFYKSKIKEGLSKRYEKSKQKEKNNNFKQLILFLIGIVFLFISAITSDETIFKEVFLIVGWVPIWEVIDIQLFSDLNERKNRKIIKRLLKSNILIKK